MAIFGNPPASQKSDASSAAPPAKAPPREDEPRANVASFTAPEPARQASTPQRSATPDAKESVIASDLTIEGRIEGSGHVRLAGRFKGDVNVQGDLTIEVGAKLDGGVKARKVIIAGELEGNIESAERVELLDSGAMTGDIKAGTVTVAAGSRMKGQVEFGWSKDGKGTGKGRAGENGADA